MRSARGHSRRGGAWKGRPAHVESNQSTCLPSLHSVTLLAYMVSQKNNKLSKRALSICSFMFPMWKSCGSRFGHLRISHCAELDQIACRITQRSVHVLCRKRNSKRKKRERAVSWSQYASSEPTATAGRQEIPQPEGKSCSHDETSQNKRGYLQKGHKPAAARLHKLRTRDQGGTVTSVHCTFLATSRNRDETLGAFTAHWEKWRPQ